ncbi:DUF2231 domain-containing protein [Mycobacterium angelicum]|uniref:DUF2231 domain-containing protein n=1 Tax=Mycobacterium angelicum TaxID=470074 RepID=A0A1X0A2V2_MYCAN|nr:DUF2231 domain-containing protein [Mycobacterium angelicum]MCV7197381.1 DUF2231 domain-containing protein [Mycobacterium angelicum]ORA24198.1 hypothetical protein BST12_05270 [Mycobacterium angelicum]
MESRAKALGHAIHPMLIPFPLGLLATAVVFDIVYLITDKAGFALASAYAIGAGIIGGLIAAPFGWIDWLKIPRNTRAKRVGLVHGLGNLLVVVLFAVSWALRANSDGWVPTTWALGCSFVAVVVATAAGWLGGELVERLGVGVDDGAHTDAPSSLAAKRVGTAPTAT